MSTTAERNNQANQTALAQGLTFVWHQLFTEDREAAIDFYTRLFGWSTDTFPDMNYKMLAANGGAVAGVIGNESCGDMRPSKAHWSVTIGVDDVDAKVEACQKLGGEVLVPPMDIPTVGRTALVRDPQGADFWMIQFAR